MSCKPIALSGWLILALTAAEYPTEDLARAQAEELSRQLWTAYAERFKEGHARSFREKKVRFDQMEMRFEYKTFGDRPLDGRSVYLSLHGGGETTPAVNDGQWRNQLRLYQPSEGIYVCPRAPTDAWNMWHQPHMDALLDDLIRCLVIFEQANPNRVYLLGYSAGGDGVYQLAPRMADRFAAAAMMAGHPNDAAPLGLRNLPFAIHVGEKDSAYERNAQASLWRQKLETLRAADPDGYVHEVRLHQGKGHWLDRQDAAALAWMAKFTRNPLPKKVAWKQDDVVHSRFYWLAAPEGQSKPGAEVVASIDGQTVTLQSHGIDRLVVRLNDQLVDLDQPLTVKANGKVLSGVKVARRREVIQKTIAERGDPRAIFFAELTVELSDSMQDRR
jgi:poly(3-hydroxybutyrate) depolymerase